MAEMHKIREKFREISRCQKVEKSFSFLRLNMYVEKLVTDEFIAPFLSNFQKSLSKHVVPLKIHKNIHADLSRVWNDIEYPH